MITPFGGDSILTHTILVSIFYSLFSPSNRGRFSGLPPLRHWDTGCRPRQSEQTWLYLHGLKEHRLLERPLYSWHTSDWLLERGRVHVREAPPTDWNSWGKPAFMGRVEIARTVSTPSQCLSPPRECLIIESEIYDTPV